MTRYILFDGAPTTRDCLASIRDSNYSSKWHTSTCQFPSTRPQNGGDTTASQFKDAHEEQEDQEDASKGKGGKRNRKETVEGGGVEEGEVQKKKPRTSWEGGESTCQSFFMFPPPSQPRKPGEASYRITRSQLRQQEDTTASFSRILHNPNETTRANLTSITERSSPSPQSRSQSLDDSFNATSNSEISISPPPRFLWKLHDLTKLSQLRSRLTSHPSRQYKPDPTVSVLGVVSVLTSKETSVGRVTEVVLEDETGGKCKVVSWGQQGIELNEVLDLGDVVYFGKVRLKKSKFDPTQLELSLIDNASQVGIAYRTRVFDTQDEVFQFHEAWSRTEGEARAVMEIVEWWMQNRET